MAQPGFGPSSLPVGTEVSAKYRGAFCEARVKTVVRVVKCKVIVKDCQSSIFVTDDEVKGPVKLGAVVEVKHPDTGQPVEASINKLIDNSTYTVVFDDGDERTLRRSQLCLKGDKHFIESETLDNLPLSHPEHFGTPVLQNKKVKRKNEDSDEDGDGDDSEGESPRRAMYRGRHQELVGQLMLMDLPHRKGSIIPALVVLPDANSLSEVKNREQILVRSFKDSKFMTVTRKDLKEFSRVVAIKNEDKTMRAAFEKALLYYDTKELPVGWDKEEMLGSDMEDEAADEDENEYASEDEPFEEKDRFVAQLYKFMDDRGTPINKGPCIGNKDLNLYKLFQIVQNLGGYNKVTKEIKWPVVYSKMGLPSLHQNPAHQIKTAYKKYLDAYETFYRKLGSTMGTLSRPGRARQNSGRSFLNFRGREKSQRTPKPQEKSKDQSPSCKVKVETSLERTEDPQDSVSLTSADDSDVVTRRTPHRDAKIQTLKEESKERKEETGKKKEEKKEDAVKARKDESPTSKNRKEEVAQISKSKKEETAKGKKEEDAKKEERKNTRKTRVDEDKESGKEEKKHHRAAKKEILDDKKERAKPANNTEAKEMSKKRMTRRKLLPLEPKKESEVKEEAEERKEGGKKGLIVKETKVMEKKEKEIPKTLERRDSRSVEKKESVLKTTEKKEVTIKTTEKKEVAIKSVEKKEIAARVTEKKEMAGRQTEKKEATVKASEKKDTTQKTAEKKEARADERKSKIMEEKLQKKEKKGRDDIGAEEAETEENGEEEEDEGSDQEKCDGNIKHDFPLGSKLRVKYGRGKNQKIYVAKVVDFDAVHKTFLVHYAGWNTRYDEWIRPDRVVSVLDRPDSDKVKTPPQRTAVTSTFKKTSPKTPSTLKKPGQIFRTPKLVSTKTRSTRSTSSDTSFMRKKTGKRMTRRGSVRTDSVGSKSPESQMSSDTEDTTESEKADDDPNSKEDKQEEEEEEILDVEDDDDDQIEDEVIKEKGDAADLNIEYNGHRMQEPFLPALESKVQDGQLIQNVDIKEEEQNSFAESGQPVSALDLDTDIDKVKDLDLEKPESLDYYPGILIASTSVPESKVERASVLVAEVKTAVDEIKSIAYDDLKDIVKEETNDKEQGLSTMKSEVASDDKEDISSPKLQIDEEKGDDDKFDNMTEKFVSKSPRNDFAFETISAPVLVADIPQLSKMDGEQEKSESSEKPRAARGRKKDMSKKESSKDGKRAFKTLDMTGMNLPQEIPYLEPIQMSSNLGLSKVEPSPYDFDDQADAPWQPEITKKWEPSQKNFVTAKDPTDFHTPREEGEEREKKKVKKKAKKKPISPEFVVDNKVEEGRLMLDVVIGVNVGDEPAKFHSTVDSLEKSSSRKKGRKKKELGGETRKEVIEQYESTVKSVAENSVKHSLQESESDHEQRPAVKRRRLKRVSESDKRDMLVRGSKTVQKDIRDPIDLISTLEVQNDTGDRPNVSHSPTPQEVPSLQPAVCSTVVVNEDISLIKNIAIEKKYPETQHFEPQPDQHEPSTGLDNTPPTTPEHDQEENVHNSLHEQASTFEIDLSTKSDIYKENAKVVCSSSSTTSSLSLPASSTNLAQSKSAIEYPSDNEVTSTASTDNLDTTLTAQQSESSGTDQDMPANKKRKPAEDILNEVLSPKKKKRVHGTRSRTAKKSPKYTGNSDSPGSSSNTPNYCPESPPTKFTDLSKSPRPSKFNFSADLGEYLEGEARCNFLIGKMREIKSIYMNLKAEVASIDRRRKRARRKERESSQVSMVDQKESSAQ